MDKDFREIISGVLQKNSPETSVQECRAWTFDLVTTLKANNLQIISTTNIFERMEKAITEEYQGIVGLGWSPHPSDMARAALKAIGADK